MNSVALIMFSGLIVAAASCQSSFIRYGVQRKYGLAVANLFACFCSYWIGFSGLILQFRG